MNRFLAPMGLGATRLPLAHAWHQYEISPNRRDIARTTLNSKRTVWMGFARWMEHNHLEIKDLAQVTEEVVSEYLAEFRCYHSATTYNNHVCVIREIFRVLADKAGITNDPWSKVCLRADDSLSRRELTVDEVERLYTSASTLGKEWKLLLMTGIYTGLRLGDCCCLKWECVNIERQVIQLVPSKTKKHFHGHMVTIPIHAHLLGELRQLWNCCKAESGKDLDSICAQGKEEAVVRHPTIVSPYVNATIADAYIHHKWKVDDGLRKIFKAANISMNMRVEGRKRKSVVASFHSLRHTFVSLSANAGVPLPVVQSIVGHCSTAMTRHYYHENEESLRAAVATIPSLDALRAGEHRAGSGRHGKDGRLGYMEMRAAIPQMQTPEQRLRHIGKLRSKGLITENEYEAMRQRILSEL